jgi:hypothetical protein
MTYCQRRPLACARRHHLDLVPPGGGEHVLVRLLQMCRVDCRGVIVHVEVKPSHRRMWMAAMVIACAVRAIGGATGRRSR